MLESVLWTGRGPLGGSQPGVKSPCVLLSATDAQWGLSGMFSLHQGPKPTKAAQEGQLQIQAQLGAHFPLPQPWRVQRPRDGWAEGGKEPRK